MSVSSSSNDSDELCANPASPSYGTRVCTSLPSPETNRYTGDRNTCCSEPTIEEIDDDDAMETGDSSSAARAADMFMQSVQSSSSSSSSSSAVTVNQQNGALVSQSRIPPLSQIPLQPLVPWDRLISTGVTGYFEGAQKSVDYQWVLEQRTRLTNTYKSVLFYPFAAIAVQQNISQQIEQFMRANWRSFDSCASYFGLAALKAWFSKNVCGPMYAREMINVTFDTKLLCRSPSGSGVRSFIIEACRQAGINLIIVNNQQVFDGEMTDLVATSHKCQPCIVLFNRCDNWFAQEYQRWGQAYVSMLSSYQSACSTSAHAAFGLGGAVAVRPDKVWTIYSVGTYGNLNDHFYHTIARETIVCTPPTPAEREQFMTAKIGEIFVASFGETSTHLVSAAAGKIQLLAKQYVATMSTASLGEMFEMIRYLHDKKRRDLAFASALSPPGATDVNSLESYFPTMTELRAEIEERRARSNQNAHEARRLASNHQRA